MSRQRLRTTFDEVAELYDRVRPRYPAELFDDLGRWIPPGARVLEIGPGTGQATAALAERGYEVVAVELGPRLTEIARARVPAARVVRADFETWEPERGDFDAVVSFSAFHWIDARLRYAKPLRLLRARGALAIVETQHVRDDDPFWLDVQEDYDAVVPDPANAPSPLPEEVGDLRGELEAHGYVDVAARRHLRTVTYTADEYRALLASYSPNIARDADTTRRLLDRVHARIAARPGGHIAKPYLFVLSVGRAPG